MKVLEVYGDGDYAAVDFENNVKKHNYIDFWNRSKEAGKSLEHVDDDNEAYFEYKAHEFGEVDPAFISFIDDLIDYDDSKHHNYYIVEE